MCDYTGPEDGSLGDRFVNAVIVAVNDVAGDGLSGHGGKVVYLLPDVKSQKLFVLSVSKEQSILTPGVPSGQWGVGLLLRNCCKWQLRLTYWAKGSASEMWSGYLLVSMAVGTLIDSECVTCLGTWHWLRRRL